MTILESAHTLTPKLREWRRAIHARPEMGNDLPSTQQRVLIALRELGVENLRLGESQSSVIATIDGALPGPTTLLRADMDALPIDEPEGLPYRSQMRGVMHACGHDAHTAMLLGAAALLIEHRAKLGGRVILAFQPGEEGHGGAEILVSEGALAGVDRAFALHVAPPLPVGLCGGKPGAIMASSDTFSIQLEGEGGHGSAGGGEKSPLSMAARLVEQLETVGKQTEEAVIVSVGAFRSGSSPNVLPASARLDGTLRAFSAGSREAAMRQMETLLLAGLERSAVSGQMSWNDAAAPLTVNDREVFRAVREVAERMLGSHAFLQLEAPVAASEDFSVIASKVPSTLLFLGAGDPERDCGQVHSPSLLLDERCLPIGAALYAAVAIAAAESAGEETV